MANPAEGAAPTEQAAPRASAATRIAGVDVSNYQHPNGAAINWGAVAGSGKRFALIKATEGPVGCTGGPYTNPYFASDYAGAGAAGMWRGAYSFARPRLPLSSAGDDARRFVSVAGTGNGPRDLPAVLDMEVSCGLSAGNLVAWTRAWLDTVRSLTGVRPIVYTGYYFWRDNLGNDTSIAGAGFPLWMARYQAAQPEPLPGGWATWSFWQWTGSGMSPGISGLVDLNYYNGDESSLGLLVAASKGTTPTLSIDHNADGRAEFVFVDGLGNLLQRWEWDDRTFSAVVFRQANIAKATIARNADGRLEIFAIRNDGYLIHSWQECAGCDWTGWFPMAWAVSPQTLAVAPNADGRLELVVRNGYGMLVHSWQLCPNCGWSGWYSMGAAGRGQVALAANADGRLELFTVSPSVSHAWQEAPNGNWSAWYGLAPGGDFASTIAATRTAGGSLVATWHGTDLQTAYAARQVWAGGWGGWDNPRPLPWKTVDGPSLSDDGSTTWVAACNAQSQVVSARLNDANGVWTAAPVSTAVACRATGVLADRPGPLILTLGDGVLAAIPGKPAQGF